MCYTMAVREAGDLNVHNRFAVFWELRLSHEEGSALRTVWIGVYVCEREGVSVCVCVLYRGASRESVRGWGSVRKPLRENEIQTMEEKTSLPADAYQSKLQTLYTNTKMDFHGLRRDFKIIAE